MGKIFIVDIDGVVCEHVDNERPEKMADAAPYQESISKINQWFDGGHQVCFFTARTEEHRSITEEWLKGHGMKYHKLIFGKPRRKEGEEYHYIDDTPIRATTYKGTFSDLVKKRKEILVFKED